MPKMKHHFKTKFVSAALILSTALVFGGCGSKKAYMTYDIDATRTTFEPGDSYMEITGNSAVSSEGISLMTKDLTVIKGDEKSRLKGNPEFNAKAVFVADNDNNEALYVKHCFKRLYPASLTKLMTALVTYKNMENLEENFIVTKDCLDLPDPYAKKMGLQVGDSVKIHDLLRAALIPSYNDAAKVLAIAVAGSEKEFVKMMNDEAKELGATRTHFTNCHGLHDKNHYTTLYDLYLIEHELMKNSDFVKTVNTPSVDIKYKNTYGTEKVFTLKSTNGFLTGATSIPEGITVVGGKTGTTDEAGACMLLYIKDSAGKGYYAGVLGATDHLNLYAALTSIFNAIGK